MPSNSVTLDVAPLFRWLKERDGFEAVIDFNEEFCLGFDVSDCNDCCTVTPTLRYNECGICGETKLKSYTGTFTLSFEHTVEAVDEDAAREALETALMDGEIDVDINDAELEYVNED